MQADAKLVFAVTQGVVDQVIQHALHQAHIQRTVIAGAVIQQQRALWIHALHILNMTVDPGRQVGRTEFKLVLRAIESGVGQQLFDQRFKLAHITIKRLQFCFRQVFAHLQAIAQAHQRRAQFVCDAVDQ
ncbi:hypothetical protein D3C85_1224170 [compost metagenome]